jgi:hypothetical protein
MDNIHNKPKLVFFQVKYDQKLPAFLLTHKREHVTCLSEWFDVTVINEDCDYQQICDKYEPAVTLFESGVNHETCQRLDIQNIRSCSKIPKLGLHHADAFCNARAGFLSDMDHWGIDTFFGISTTAAEHTPEIANSLFVWPVFVDATIYRDYGGWKSIPVLVTGNRNQLYPWRKQIVKRLSENYPTLLCPHPGYEASAATSRVLMGEDYARTINASWFVPACGTVAKEVVRKHFEVPASRACLIAERSPALEAAGFMDMKNCVFADDQDVLEKLDYLFRNPDVLNEIINAGYKMVHSRHTLKHRDQIFQWFNLYKTVKPNQQIIQTGPFQPLSIAENSRRQEAYHITSNGLHLELFRQGDEMLWAGKYKEAEGFYIRCTRYMPWMPEPKVRLALCNLYRGNAKRALSWIDEPIQFILCVYKAIDPDPVEWAYYIVSLLCLGKLEVAARHAHEFTWLRHPELDRARWATRLLKKSGDVAPLLNDANLKRRFSVHQLPARNLKEWVGQLSIMLSACGQGIMTETLTSYLSEETRTFQSRRDGGGANGETGAEGVTGLQRRVQSEGPFRLGTKDAFGLFKRRIFYSKGIAVKLTRPVKAVVHRLEARYGYFMPYHLSESRKDECFHAIEELARDEDVKAILVIGAASREGSTEAVLAGVLKNKATPSVFCVSDSVRRFKNLRRTTSSSAVVWHRLSYVRPENLSEELEETIEEIKRKNEISFFDVILVSGCKFGGQVAVSEVLSAELANARVVVLDDINSVSSYRNYDRLLRNPKFVVVDHDPALRNGYAIFKARGSARSECDSAV